MTESYRLLYEFNIQNNVSTVWIIYIYEKMLYVNDTKVTVLTRSAIELNDYQIGVKLMSRSFPRSLERSSIVKSY